MTEKNDITGLDRLFQEVGTYRSSNDYMVLLEFINRFRKKCHKIAPYNAMLIHMQKPGSTYVASVKEWREKFGRRPKPGARPLIILRTFGPISFVYELEDTEGRDFPQKLQSPFQADGEFSDKELEQFKKNLQFNGYRIREENYGTGRAGQAQAILTHGTYKNKDKCPHSFRMPFAITINSNHDKVTQLTTIYHELGHIYCGHLGSQGFDFLLERFSSDIQANEFEAESVCWLLCEHRGIKNPSAEYLSGYLKDNEKIPNISIETVLKAAAKIEQMQEHNLRTPRKDLRED